MQNTIVLHGKNLASFRPESPLPAIVRLDLSANPLQETEFLKFFPRLQELNLSNCVKLKALQIPESLQVTLKRLDISNTKVTSLQELSLPVLEYLNISCTGVR